MDLPTNPVYYVMNTKGTIYHLVTYNDAKQTAKTYCGYEVDLNERTPVNTPQNRKDLLCKRCAKSYNS